MTLEQKRNTLIAGLLIALVVVVSWIYKPNNTTPANSLNATSDPATGSTFIPLTDNNIAIPHGDNDAEYNEYVKYLEWRCPVYVPSGNAWKNCLYDLQLARESEVKIILDRINAELPKTIERLNRRKEMTVVFEQIPGMLKEFNKSWFDYRDKLCELDHKEYAAGSWTEGYVTECQIFETQKYINLLNDFDKRWNIDYEKSLDEMWKNI